jgi:hypothetical protein
VEVGNIATITSSSLPATGVTYSTLTTGTGLNVTIPDATTKIILYNVPCSNQVSYTFPTPTPTPTPTNTPTPTPTPTPDPYVYYNANVGRCTDCGPAPVPTEHIKFLAPFTPTTGKVYISSPFLGYFYSNLTSIATDLSAILMDSTEYSGCATACGFTPTPTPTPTNTPTPTPTPTATPVLYAQTLSLAVGAFADRLGPTACAYYRAGSTATYYSDCQTLTNGCYIYANNTGGSVSQVGWFSNGSSYWVLDGPRLTIRAGAACPTVTPTPTPTFTPTPTPTSTPIPVYSFDGYSGTTAAHACDNSSGVITVYYTGTLGIGTDLYNENTLTTAVDNGYYFYNETHVYHVGFPSVESGRITEIVSCPTPTPTPTPTGAGYYDDGYGCIYHTSDPGAGFVACNPNGPQV